MNPLRPVVRSVSSGLQRMPAPAILASNRWTVILSPGFISRVCALGVKVASVAQLRARRARRYAVGLDEAEVDRLDAVVVAGPDPLPVHSRLSMVSAEHQWVLSQLMLSTNGAKTGRVELQLHEGRPAAREIALRRVGVRARAYRQSAAPSSGRTHRWRSTGRPRARTSG